MLRYFRPQHDTALYHLGHRTLKIEPLHTKSLFTHCQSLPNYCHNQIMVIITFCSPEWSNIKWTWMPLPVYQDMVSLIVGLSIRRCQSKFMNVMMWKHYTFDMKKLTALTCVNSHSQFLVWKCLLWHWNLLTKFSFGILRIYQIHILIPCRSCASHHQFYPLLGHKWSEQRSHISDLLISCATASHQQTHPTANMTLCIEKTILFMILIFASLVSLLSHLTSCTPTTFNLHFYIFLD
jgi:hypothetical protein